MRKTLLFAATILLALAMSHASAAPLPTSGSLICPQCPPPRPGCIVRGTLCRCCLP